MTAPPRPLVALAAICLCLALTATSASATVSYPSPQTLSDDREYASQPQLAIDGAERATVVWNRRDGSNSRIQSVRLGADGTPGAVQTLSEAGEDAAQAQVVIDGADRATIVWLREEGSDTRIQSVRLDADGTPGAVQTLSVAGEYPENPQLAIDGSGRATIVWRGWDGTSYRVHTVRLAADGTPGPVQLVSEAGPAAFLPQVAVDGSGRATILWLSSIETGFDEDPINSIQSVRLAADGTPGPVRNLSGSGQDVYQRGGIAIDGAGRATITWIRYDGANYRIQAVRLGAAAGNPGPVRTLSEAGHDAGQGQVAVDGSGRVTVAWKEYFNEVGSGQIVRIAADGTPGAPQEWGGDGDKQIEIAIDGFDRPTIVHGDEAGGVSVIRFAAQGTPVPVSEKLVDTGDGESGSAQIAIDGSDRPTIVFVRDGYEANSDHIASVRGAITYPETTIISGPSDPTRNGSPSFGFAADVPAPSFECSLDSEPFSPCTSQKSYSDLADGPHSFGVRAIDVEGDRDPTPAERSFEVDTTANAACRRAIKKLGKAERKLERRKERLGRASRERAKRRSRRKVRRARAELARAEERVDAVC